MTLATPTVEKLPDPHVGRSVAATVRNLYAPSPAIYWADFLSAAALGWAAFAIACIAAKIWWTFVAGVAAVLLLYRAHLFVHELSHSAARLRGFLAAWNLLAGFPLLVPSCFAVGVHALHHSIRIYGTPADPEYLPFARSRGLTVRFVRLTVVFPLLMVARFLLLGPAALLVPRLQSYLERHASSLAMNPSFIRRMTPAEHGAAMRQQLGILALWTPCIALLLSGLWPIRVALTWLAVASGISVVNGVRALGAHRYLGEGPAFSRIGQFTDSIDTPGAWWTEVWAPVGHRYHALHHYLPGLPYHNLGAAYRRLTEARTCGLPLAASASSGLPASLRRLWASASAAPRTGR